MLSRLKALPEELILNQDGSLTIVDNLKYGTQTIYSEFGTGRNSQVITSTLNSKLGSITAEGSDQAYKLDFDNLGNPISLTTVSPDGALDNAGNFYATGSLITDSINLGNTVINRTINPSTYLAKVGSSGELAWSRILSGSGGSLGAFLTTEISKPLLDSEGNVYVTGQFNSNNLSINGKNSLTNLSLNGGEHDAFLAKFSSNGELSWIQQFASTGSDEIRGPQFDSNENVYVSGSFTGNTLRIDNTHITNQSPRLGSRNYFLAQFDREGALNWVDRTAPLESLRIENNGPGFSITAISNEGASPAIQTFELQAPPTNPDARGDFNQDGRSDIVLRNNAIGSHIIRYMDGFQITQADSPVNRAAVEDATWRTQTTGDFNGDGKADLLLRHFTSGQNLLIAMDGAEIISESLIGRTVEDLNWEIVGSGDFNSDAQDDILLYNAATGQTLAWYMDSQGQILGENLVGRSLGENSGWDIVGTADFNRDLQTDIVLRHAESGQNLLWTMDNAGIAAEGLLGRNLQDPNWQVAGTGDFDGDGDGDLLWRYIGNAPTNNSAGNDLIWMMEGTQISQEFQLAGIPDKNWQFTV